LNPPVETASARQLETRLSILAATFLGLYAAALTISPAVWIRSWQTSLRWDHWIGLAAWLACYLLILNRLRRRLPVHDPFLLPIAGLLSGWGLLEIWRIYPEFGIRQAAWLAFTSAVILAGLLLPADLRPVRRFKYLWLTGGLALTALTLLVGLNPFGGGYPRLWLGFAGVYLQPSEPLKLLLLIYLAAFLADRYVSVSGVLTGARPPILPLLAPTIIMTGAATLLMIIQRDLGTALVILFLYAMMVYLATGYRQTLGFLLAAAAAAGTAGYLLFDVVRIRIDAWLNPWIDPIGRSYQIVQALISAANGGVLGRGPGLGSPSLVPVAHSDFIFTAISEELGLIGGLGLLVLLSLLAQRGLKAAIAAPGAFRRYLAAGLTAFLVGQAILIIGGNLRLLPLTGVTLPFVSYGGSSLLTSWLCLLLLLLVGSGEHTPAPLPDASPYRNVLLALLAGLAAAGLALGWWKIVRGPELTERTDNARRAVAERFVQRGAILDRANRPINLSEGSPGNILRRTTYPPLSNIIGYTNIIYGQSGLENSQDVILRGLIGYSSLTVFWEHLLYGTPPPGLDVRLSLDMDLQTQADQVLGTATGAIVLLNARSGEILAMASHPGFDSNRLETDHNRLASDPTGPLTNRAVQRLYPAGAALAPILLAGSIETGQIGQADTRPGPDCALPPPVPGLSAAVSSGCAASLINLAELLGAAKLEQILENGGIYRAPNISLAVAPAIESPGPQASVSARLNSLQISPLQAVVAIAPLSAAGMRPAPTLVTAFHSPGAGWVVTPPESTPRTVLPADAARRAAAMLSLEDGLWGASARANAPASNESFRSIAWFLGGSQPGSTDLPLTVVVVLENGDPQTAREIGLALLHAARP
jgi:cell division protein FtsW (lipid II flippase)